MNADQRKDLAKLFPLARPVREGRRIDYIGRIRDHGDLAEPQLEALNAVLDGSWTVEALVLLLNDAGKIRQLDRSACEMQADQARGLNEIPTEKASADEDVSLNQAQVVLLREFAISGGEMFDNDGTGSMRVDTLVERLQAAGDFVDHQAKTLRSFMSTVPTIGKRNKAACFAMMKAKDEAGKRLPLTVAQQDLLLSDFRDQAAWEHSVGELYLAAHVDKFRWSGEYRSQGHPFWWLYEYVFKPLQATIFAMLAFYVASAAFRAFRAKNFEAMLLLGTAFIILLGRTFAGVWLTSWMPDVLSGLKIENLTVTIMKVFNTAGNRAVMIGIALGIASTSLKVLLGVDRSYLGGGQD